MYMLNNILSKILSILVTVVRWLNDKERSSNKVIVVSSDCYVILSLPLAQKFQNNHAILMQFSIRSSGQTIW